MLYNNIGSIIFNIPLKFIRFCIYFGKKPIINTKTEMKLYVFNYKNYCA